MLKPSFLFLPGLGRSGCVTRRQSERPARPFQSQTAFFVSLESHVGQTQEMPYPGYTSSYWYPTGPQTPYPSDYSPMMNHQMPPQGLVNGVFPGGRPSSPGRVPPNTWYPTGPSESCSPESIPRENIQQQQQLPSQQAGLSRPPSNGHAPATQWAHSQHGAPSHTLSARTPTPAHPAYGAPSQREVFDQPLQYPVTSSQYHFRNPESGPQQPLYPPQHQAATAPGAPSQPWTPSTQAPPLQSHDPWAQSRVPGLPASAQQYPHVMPPFRSSVVSTPAPGWQNPSLYEQKDVPYPLNHQDMRGTGLSHAGYPGTEQQSASYPPVPSPEQPPSVLPTARVEYSAPPTMYKTRVEGQDAREAASEGAQPPGAASHPGHAKVEQVLVELRQLEAEVDCFEGTRGDKAYRRLEELLTKQLLELDAVETDGHEHVRQARKEAVHRIQGVLEKLETLAG
ncbi:BAG family molecular chaperone regulator 4 isoform X1 [Chiloscyllium plagiosum]|uniref:BAG family molecular chaperone regulator 4 isoform X1 n=1 Tax=Chiloscyllium plagiosum TaxID=36176 RepID=UPI001CB8436C|nr:BAG family molecular chaperone regulator 4 isoform X1 [Chiloscyllium plagiosum]